MPAHAVDYLLGISDKVLVKVVDWQSANATVRSWDAIGGEYTVNAAGALSLPLIGETPVAGKTPAQVASEISDLMQQKLALIDRPYTSVEVSRYRPFYIYGSVQNPGEYPYSPDLTVMRALSIAGGARRVLDLGQRIQRDLINARFNYNLATEQRNRSLALKARLLAELENSDSINFPDDLNDVTGGDMLKAAEVAIFEAGRSRMEIRVAGLDNLRGLFTAEIESLDKKAASQERQLKLAREELDGISSLAQQGLVVNQRVLAIERNISDLEGRLIDLGTQSLRAKQEIVKADQDQDSFLNNRKSELTVQLQSAEAELNDSNSKMALYARLVDEAIAIDPLVASSTGVVSLRYRITRGVGADASSVDVSIDAEVNPGDVVEVMGDLEQKSQ